MSEDYAPSLRRIAAAQAVLALSKIKSNKDNQFHLKMAKRAAEEKLLKLWAPQDAKPPSGDEIMESFEPI